MTDEYDYIIVGAGPSAMGLLNRLLSEKDLPKIAVLERGPASLPTSQPHRWFADSHTPGPAVSLYTGTTPAGRVLHVPVGRGLGGGTNIHACLCLAPLPEDFVTWPEPWRSSLMASVAAMQATLVKNQALSRTIKSSRESSAAVPCTTRATASGHHVRVNYFAGLVQPMLPHPSVSLLTDCEVQRLLFTHGRATGVEYSTNGLDHCLHARRGVVLCAGAIETPLLLQVSGIGSSSVLSEAGVNLVAEIHGVGRNLRDHLMLPRAIYSHEQAGQELSVNGVRQLHDVEVEGTRWQIGFMDAAIFADVVPSAIASMFWWQGSNKLLNALSQFLFRAVHWLLWCLFQLPPFYWFLRHHVCSSSISVFHLNPVSCGRVGLRRVAESTAESTSSVVQRRHVVPVIELGYLADKNDLHNMVKGWETSKVIAPGVEIFPGPLVRKFGSQQLHLGRFYAYCAAACLPYYHWCGTCAMITDGDDSNNDWVVDARLRVRQVDGLYVCDASVLPTLVSAPTALTCAALGHLFGSILLEAYRNE